MARNHDLRVNAHNDENHPTSTGYYIMEDYFALRYARIYPGVNSRAELVTLAPGLRQERRFAPLARLGITLDCSTDFVLQAANSASYEGTTISSDFAIYKIASYNLLFTIQAVLQNYVNLRGRVE